MSATTHDLTAMIASRICHDLISPLGAISNGVELLQLTMAPPLPPELQLIADSIRSANARTLFLRLAFGIAGEGQLMGQAELSALVSAWAEGGRIRIDWQPGAPCSRSKARRACLALLCLEAALPQGGVIRVSDDGRMWRFRAEGRRVRLPPELWHMLTEPQCEIELSPGRIQFALLRGDLLEGAGLAAGRIDEEAIELLVP
ncbi:histidine phosphotransferase family protein [Falsigemmobacter faecalis]|uniref:Histidine phosphotransferase n=1 Tax=Falsigemmobacter faecalis TaxID=2488730 RepID=A0A3P3DQQ5_9RHOB|nr:histidine phosphotransferase family protein [Falsigemmobacter faecalis]RRH76590.1 histidine phosphotransferase [Falsigemmobacter faecalis]